MSTIRPEIKKNEDTFEACFHGSIFTKTEFCLGEKQGMLVSNESSSWYNRVGNFLYQFGIREKDFCTSMAQHAWPDRPTPAPEGVVNGTECYDG